MHFVQSVLHNGGDDGDTDDAEDGCDTSVSGADGSVDATLNCSNIM